MNQKVINLVLIGIVTLLVIGGGYFAWKGKSNNTENISKVKTVDPKADTNNEAVPETMTVKIYFVPKNSEQLSCNDVIAVTRIVPKTVKVGTAALEELLKGPTLKEVGMGYSTSIPLNSKLNSLTIVNGEARVDFNSITESGGGSCSMGIRTTQISQTLLQFPTVKTVKFSIDGRTEDIFQP